MRHFLIFFILIQGFLQAQTLKKYNVNGIQREALVFIPEIKTANAPVVFVFHGHGGNAQFASRNIHFQNYFKEAIVVFMQGIPGRTSKGIDPIGKLNGWQFYPGDLQNRDVDFFDSVLSDLKENFDIDDQKIYAVGHSNGAKFVNVLWIERGHQLAAICSASAQGGKMVENAPPVSVWMSVGKKDFVVPLKNQLESVPPVMEALKINPSTKKVIDEKTYYSGLNDTELVVQITDYGHAFPKNSIPEIVDFFKNHSR